MWHPQLNCIACTSRVHRMVNLRRSSLVLALAAVAVGFSILHQIRKYKNIISLEESRKLASLVSFADTFPDRNLVLDLMQLSEDIYAVDENGISASDAISDPKFEEVLWIEADFSTEVLVVRSRQDRDFPPIVVFRGSEEFDDWLVNANILLVKSKFQNAPDSVEMHQGFQNALFDQNVIGKVEEKVLDMVGEKGEVIVTGHSLGGANAHICAVHLAYAYSNMKVNMINFGAPRFGNDHFKSWTEESLTNLSAWRYVYRKDIVPRIIPKSLGYRHAGHLFAIYGYESEVYYRQSGGGEYEGAPLSWYYATSIRHHKGVTYINFFNNNINDDEFWPNDFERGVPSPPSTSTVPTTSSSRAPTTSPSPPPSTSATPKCSDAPIRLKLSDGNVSILRYCKWVANKDTKNRCAITGVSQACPVTCETCATCEDPELQFKFDYNRKSIVRRCNFMGRIPSKLLGRCLASGNICRKTCAMC